MSGYYLEIIELHRHVKVWHSFDRSDACALKMFVDEARDGLLEKAE